MNHGVCNRHFGLGSRSLNSTSKKLPVPTIILRHSLRNQKLMVLIQKITLFGLVVILRRQNHFHHGPILLLSITSWSVFSFIPGAPVWAHTSTYGLWSWKVMLLIQGKYHFGSCSYWTTGKTIFIVWLLILIYHTRTISGVLSTMLLWYKYKIRRDL